MLTLLATFPPVDCNSPAFLPLDTDAPAECEPTGPAPADAQWWASQSTGGCLDSETSPEQRLIDAGPSALAHFLDQCGDEYAALDRHESGYAFC